MRRSFLPFVALLALALGAFAACTPSIGDKCVLSTDCSVNGDRLCDTSQPGGYCTVFNCVGDGCPDKAACVLFNAGIPGCGYNDRSGPNGSRVGRSFCVQQCNSTSDCRDGYVCADPRRPPWNALIMDDPQNQLTCLVKPDGFDDDGGALASTPPPSNAPVCGPVAPDVPPIDASPPRIVSDAGVDAKTD
jgi:hypothetical protein